ncbi:hypothetical protein PC121_g9630 [Phytophthora cactorum]|nr:hypothetical protein PC121_g9630 [Phytophthora cactorum]
MVSRFVQGEAPHVLDSVCVHVGCWGNAGEKCAQQTWTLELFVVLTLSHATSELEGGAVSVAGWRTRSGQR